MANKFQVKRTSVSGRTPNTTNSGNTHFIDTGELALNLTDGKLFSSNGSVSFEVGANLASLKVTGEANVSTLKVTGLANVSTLNVIGDANVAGKLSVTASSGDEGGEIFLAAPANTTITNGITIDSYQNKIRFFEQGGSARGAYIDLTACAGGVGTNLLTGGSGISQVNTGNGLTGGPITSSGTVSVLANTGIIANATGLYVNSTYIATLAANSSTYLGGNTALDLRNYSDTKAATAYTNAASYADTKAATAYTNAASYADTKAATAYTNAASYADTVAGTAYTNAVTYSSNATNISSGTLNAARLPASVVQNTDSRTLSGNLVISGTYFNPSANTILLGNTTQRWVVSANTINASGLLTATAGANIQGTANLVDVNISGNLTVSGTTTYINTTNLNVGDNIVTLNADLTNLTAPTENAGLEVNRGSSANVNFLWNETSDSWTLGNTSITGFTNATGNINAASLTVGTSFLANSTDVQTTGVFTSTSVLNAANGGGQIYLNDTTGNRIDWNVNGLGAPSSNTTRSAGTKLVLRPGPTGVDYGIGIESGYLWYSVAAAIAGYKWYANTTNFMIANTTGAYHTGTINAASFTVGSNFVANSTAVQTTEPINSTAAWDATTGGGQIYLSDATGNRIDWVAAGIGAPTVTSARSAGTKLVLYPGGSATGVDYAIGVESAYVWYSGASLATGHKWYANTTNFMTANVTGLYHSGIVNAASHTVGSTFVANSTAVVISTPLTANTTTGTAGQVLTSNGATGSPYWATVSAGLSIGGSNTQVQFNNSGALGGDALFTFSNATDILTVGNTTVGSINSGVASPSSVRGIQQQKIYSTDTSPAGIYSDVTRNDAVLTAARSVVGVQAITVSNTADANSTGGILGSDAYGVYSSMYNGEAAAHNARLNNLYAGYFIARNYAGGTTANTVDFAHGLYTSVGVYSSGTISTAYGARIAIAPANTTVSGTITTAYGVHANIQSNTASAVANATLYYGVYNGTNFTGSKFGLYITGESNNYVSSNFAIGGNASALIFRATSDERLKTDIEIVGNPIEKIQSLKGVNFTYTASNTRSIGVIAQDVEKQMPELVDINSEGYRQVNYNGIIGVLIEAVKQQQKEIDNLKQIIKQL